MERGTALITGASSGIGEAFARLFAREGFNLILTARSEDKLKSLSESLDGVETELVIADLSESQGIGKLIREVDEKGKSIDIIVNNAGMTNEGPFHFYLLQNAPDKMFLFEEKGYLKMQANNNQNHTVFHKLGFHQ